ncbi:MAG: L-serine ammonia-lyase, iron-sulfur-dependent, subunit alpha, partial [Clostridia bacterium]|nr:L-serine ammonia-lyase, iron-sulfur-dependent, subunit alpha [Clostridia bacterium]
VNLDDVKEVIERQIEYNTAIAEEGLKNDYGARVGKLLLKNFGNDIHNVAKATAAAGSDARMNGCSMPVVIVSGSGNQGMTTSLPVIVFAKHLQCTHEQLLRALVLSNLVTIRLKARIGRLSAYCGAVSAGCGAAAGVCKLRGGNASEISHAIVNAIAIDSGMICDGAKSSCAAKIASAVESGLVGMEMALSGTNFSSGDGILFDSVEETIDGVGSIAHDSMRETDETIIKLMIKS